MQAQGSNGQVLIDFETTPGQTPASPSAIVLAFNKSSVKADQNQTAPDTITGRRDPAEPYRGFINVSGDTEYPLDVRQIGYLLKAGLGAPTTTGTGPYTHVFKLGAAMPYFCYEQGFKDISTYALYNGCKLSKLGFSFGGDKELTVTSGLTGMKETIDDESFDDAPTSLTLTRFNFDQATIKEGGSTIGNSTTADINIDFNLDGDTYCIGGGGFRSAINEGLVKISGSVKALFENQVLLNKAVNGTDTSLEIKLINGAHSLTVFLPEVKYKRNTPGIDGPKGVLIDLPYDGFYKSNADNTSLKITLVNDVASYA